MKISKRAIAREWLMFLALFPLGFPACFLLGYYWENFRDAYFSTFYLRHHYGTGYDGFWNDAFGLGNVWSLALWIVPYLAVTLLRSVWWSLKTLFPGRNSKRVTFYSLLAVSLITLVCLGVLTAPVIKKKFFSGESRKANVFDQFDPDKYLADSSAKANWQPPEVYEALMRVSADDLKKITLFDVGAGTAGQKDRVYSFHGRVRSNLARAVEKLGVKVSFYNSAGQLIEVKTFWLHGISLSPGSPASFDEQVQVNYLPEGWRCQLGLASIFRTVN